MTTSDKQSYSSVPKELWQHGHCVKAARVGTAFDSELSLPADFVIHSSEGLAVLDLELDKEKQVVSGVPNKAGEFDILLHGTSGTNKKPATVVLTVNVNPDPLTLWKDIPSDPDGQYARPDTWHSTMNGSDGMRVIAASRRGRRHAHKGDYRDDAASMRYCQDTGWWVIAVADGAGSAPLSRQGAQVAVKTMTDVLPERLSTLDGSVFVPRNETLCECMVSVAADAARKIEEDAIFSGSKVTDFSTTLIATAIKRVDDEWLCVSFSIGDGGCVIWDAPTSSVVTMSLADSGEFAGETRFLDSKILNDAEQCLDRLFVHRAPSFTALFLMTDGVSDPWFETETSLQNADKWKGFWAEQLEPIFAEANLAKGTDGTSKRLLMWLEFFIAGEHDDRTIAACVPCVISDTKGT